MTHYLHSLIKAFQRLPMKAAMLLVAILMLMPQEAMGNNAAARWEDDYLPGHSSNPVTYDATNATLTFKICVWDAAGCDAAFYNGIEGGTAQITMSKDGGKNYSQIFYIGAGYYMNYAFGGGISGYYSVGRDDNFEYSANKTFTCAAGSGKVKSYVDKKDGEDRRWVQVELTLNNQWRNCNIEVSSYGKWTRWICGDKDDVQKRNQTTTVATPYTFTVRKIDWNGGFTIAQDGTIKIPYKFEGSSRNTDGETHIGTNINESYNGTIGYKYPSENYSAGSYTFKLKDIGKNMRSSFTIQPYHEFTHDNDKGNNNGVKYYTTVADKKNFLPLPKATDTIAQFNQVQRKVTVTWKADNSNYSGGRWVIWRNDNIKLGYVKQGADTMVYSFEDTTYDIDKEKERYKIYYVMKDWADTTKIAELCSSATVSTIRKLPIINTQVDTTYKDRLVFKWTSDSFPVNWGNKFYIYIDNQAIPIDTIIPYKDGQTEFKWEHRTTTLHQDAVNGREGNIWYTEQEINGTVPHTYRIESVISDQTGEKKFATWNAGKWAINIGTVISQLDATKDAYAGQVKLSWHVNRKGSTLRQTYYIDRRNAESESESDYRRLHTFSSTDDYLFYTDDTPLPGVYYDYRVRVEELRPNGAKYDTLKTSANAIGFSQAYGTISGRITYGTTGTAVANAEVKAKLLDNYNTREQYHAIRFTGANGKLQCDYPSKEYAQTTFVQNDWTIQMWIRLDTIKEQRILKLGNNLYFGVRENGQPYFGTSHQTWFNNVSLKAHEYYHFTIVKDANYLRFRIITPQGQLIKRRLDWPSNFQISNSGSLTIGGFEGYVDEFRLWTKAITDEEILDNYDHLLVGDESNLEIYWTFDEGLRTQFFDYSRTGTVYHGHHGTMGSNTEPDPHVPEQLSLRVKTDVNGNYVIRGIPFSGEGTTYAIEPSLGSHQFNPAQQLRFISNSSLVHNGTDFTDVSSFTVSGKVVYAGTDYPVKGCNLYVDGEICTKDGENVETGKEGEFEISVPIGEHFIQVKKDGHVFADGGRYTHTFTQGKDDLTFTDSTLVNFTGRVVGGDIEGYKPVGFGLSMNNIGTATLKLTPNLYSYGRAYSLNTTTDTVRVHTARKDTINSTAWRGKNEQNNTIFIQTDPYTGEFSALIPPLDYIIESIEVESAPDLELLKNPMALNMSDPLTTSTDSATVDSTLSYYTYHTMLRQVYHSTPTFEVTQRATTPGAFGIRSFEIKDKLGSLFVDSIYYTENDSIKYKFSYPLFRSMDPYTFDLQGYEEYFNNEKNVSSRVPLANHVATIDNELSSDQEVYIEGNPDGAEPGSVNGLKRNQLRLDSAGHATYAWYGGLPKTSGNHTRTLNIYYGENMTPWSGNPLTGIVLGSIQTGNNFITGGDINVDMILRDPPGSQSFATWETGTVTTERTYVNTSVVRNNTTNDCTDCRDNWYMDFSLGLSLGGTASSGFSASGSIPIVNAMLVRDRTREKLYQATNSNTITASTTVTEAISTSANPEYDGPDADLFIGSATNYVVGETRRVDLYRDTADMTKAAIYVDDAIGVGVSFGTEFAYSRHHIENTLLPELIATRNSLLTHVEDIKNVKKDPTQAIYATLLQKTDPRFGADSTYRIIPPANFTGSLYPDSVSMFNAYINDWKWVLAKEEEEKVKAFFDRGVLEQQNKMTNLSYDAGASVSMTQTVTNGQAFARDTLRGITIHYHEESGASFIGLIGRKYEWDKVATADTTHTYENETMQTTTFSYTLQDNDAGDALTVDVYNYGAYGPIFRTRGGQTSNPYEEEVKTKYYEPGTTIMESTARIDYPLIDAEPRTRSEVPSGSAATYQLKLQNLSEVGAERPYRLFVDDAHNPNGAQLFIDGMPLTDGRVFRIPGNGQDVVKTLQLKQSNLSILNYDSIGIIFASLGQSDPMSGMPIIADTVYINAYFVPSASPATLAISTNTMNIEYDSIHNSCVTLTLSDFDRTYHNQKEFRLQCISQGGNWTDIHTFVLNKADSTSTNCSVLPAKNTVPYQLDMSSYLDGTYRFRIISVSTYGFEEITRESNEVELVKNLARPCPLGQAQPTDGILDIGDEVSVTYNIPFLSGELKKNNFIVTGVLNGSPVEHYTALRTNADNIAAQTEAKINLSGKDFSLDAWLNIHSAGTLLSHGVDKQKMVIATDEQGHMILTLGDSVYTSDAIIPRDKWVFFTMSQQVINNRSTINAAVVEGVNAPLNLFIDLDIPLYNGNGPIAVGGGADAAVHEVLLWDEARDIATAWQESSVTKSPSTRHLIGYWKMDEGEGKTIRDYARSRNMVMPAETWYLNNENKAVALNGTQHIAAYTAPVALRPQDDFAVELWIKGGAQTDTAQVFQLGEVSMWLDLNGKLHLQNNDDDHIVNGQKLNDGVWHHIMLNVRRIGTAAVYIDGQRALTISADRISSITSDPVSAALVVGARRASLVSGIDSTDAYYTYDRHFTGFVDEIRIWKTTIASDLLASKRKMQLKGDEPGLALYYPFENSLVEMTGKGTAAVVNDQTVNYVDDAPALREKPTETNVEFAFTASDTKIVIDVRETPATIDGCTLNFTVQNVRSVNGNPSQPATWSAFIHRNELVWQEDDVTIVKEEDETYTFSSVLTNRSGKPQRWSLGDLPTSLIASSTSGMLDPLEKTTITFRVNATAPIGKHERTIYAMGNNGIPTPLTLHLTVTGEVPDWSVNPQDYESSMYMVAQLDFFGNVSDDEDDIVAAFINDTCRGVAQPEYKERYDGYYLTMTIYGRPGDKDVKFRAYDASSGLVYTLVNESPNITYKDKNIVGKYDDPVLLSVDDRIEQRTTLKQGWNWISLYVKASDMNPKTVLDEIKDDVIAIKGRTDGIGSLLRTDTGWVGTMGRLLNRRSYMVKMKNERELSLIGKSVPATDTVLIHADWGWPGYYGKRRITLANAFAGADPQNGDIVRTHNAAAYFDDYEWVGSLQALEPGQGYAYYSVDPQQKWFAYPSSSVAAAPRRQMSNVQSPMSNEADADSTYTGLFAPDNEYGYPYNMILVGQVLLDNQPAPNAELGIFDGDECRSVGYTDAEGRILMLVAGEDEATLSYKLVLNDEVYETVETLHYLTDDILGTPDQPHLIRFGEGQGIEDVQGDDGQGVKARKEFRNGILYIIRNGKTYTATGAEIK